MRSPSPLNRGRRPATSKSCRSVKVGHGGDVRRVSCRRPRSRCRSRWSRPCCWRRPRRRPRSSTVPAELKWTCSEFGTAPVRDGLRAEAGGAGDRTRWRRSSRRSRSPCRWRRSSRRSGAPCRTRRLPIATWPPLATFESSASFLTWVVMSASSCRRPRSRCRSRWWRRCCWRRRSRRPRSSTSRRS